ncbi:MAG TPA: hypothetical protein PLV52_02520, partial [Candidatus Omnitrophota bacterium]|nr:hypothetical protein [Candidatus Omnitrophota bacterium]
MINFRSHFSVKIISALLILTFVTLDISWAYPEDGTPRQPAASTLALPSVGQTQPVNEFAAELQASVLAERGLVVAIYDIAKYLMGDDLHKIGQLPEQHMEGALFRRLRTYKALYGIDLSHVRFKDGVITMLYNTPEGQKSIIYISEKDNLAIRDLAGYDWVIGEKYAVKVLPEDYEKRETSEPLLRGTEDSIPSVIARRPEADEAISKEPAISEPIAEVRHDLSLPETLSKASDTSVIARRAKPDEAISIRKIITSALLMMFISPLAFSEEASIVFAAQSIFSTHPIAFTGLISMIGIGIGVALFFTSWRIFAPINWYARRLHSRRQQTRQVAVDYLMNSKNKRAIYKIAIALKDIEPNTRKDIIEALQNSQKGRKLIGTVEQLIGDKGYFELKDRILAVALSIYIECGDFDIEYKPEISEPVFVEGGYKMTMDAGVTDSWDDHWENKIIQEEVLRVLPHKRNETEEGAATEMDSEQGSNNGMAFVDENGTTYVTVTGENNGSVNVAYVPNNLSDSNKNGPGT